MHMGFYSENRLRRRLSAPESARACIETKAQPAPIFVRQQFHQVCGIRDVRAIRLFVLVTGQRI